MLTRFTVLLPLLLAMPLAAQETGRPPVPVPQSAEEAEAQGRRAESLRQEAENRHAAEQAACHQKILVNPCLEDAKKRYTQAIVEARQLDLPAREFQREARRADVEAAKARKAAERPTRDAEQQKQSARHRTEEAAKTAGREQKMTEKERKAEENRKKLAQEQANRQVKAEARARKHAEQSAKKARERAKAAQDKPNP